MDGESSIRRRAYIRGRRVFSRQSLERTGLHRRDRRWHRCACAIESVPRPMLRQHAGGGWIGRPHPRAAHFGCHAPVHGPRPGRIYGHSGGGYAATRAMLDYPHFYRAGVASASNNDMRGYLPFWAEKYQGPAETADFDILNNCTRAACLEGALLMVMSDVDDNTSPGMTVRMAAAPVSPNNDF